MPLLLLECRWGDLKPFLFCVLEALRYIYLKTKWEIQVYGNHQGFHESNLRASPVAMHPQCRFKPWNVLIKTVLIPGQHKIWSIIKRTMFIFCIECCSSSKKKPYLLPYRNNPSTKMAWWLYNKSQSHRFSEIHSITLAAVSQYIRMTEKVLPLNVCTISIEKNMNTTSMEEYDLGCSYMKDPTHHFWWII